MTDSERESVPVPGGRDVRATLDDPGGADACVVACPPHPQMGGKRTDRRIRAVSDYLTERGIACLRFDYGPWDEGPGERTDARNALGWARERFDRVGLFGYSFGGAVALLAAAAESEDGTPPEVVVALAPAARLSDDLDAAAAVAAIDSPLRIVYGERDTTADWGPVVERAREVGAGVVELPSDHHFVGRDASVGEAVGSFLVDRL
ncbi:alpha/beta hydrolase [Salinirubellus sp. GCM10025818]|uniref:alpha/beta hydrolase n=1 Tax=Salinirubellus TaxID=2162630 RepID=UPI0030CB0558